MSDPIDTSAAEPACKPKCCRWLPWTLCVVLFILLAASLAPWFDINLGMVTPWGRFLEHRFEAVRFAATMPLAPPTVSAPTPAAEMPHVDDTRVAALEEQLQQLRAARTDEAERLHDDSIKAATGAAAAATRPLLLAASIDARLAGGLAYKNELAALQPTLHDDETAALSPLANGGMSPAQLAAELNGQERTLAAAYRESLAEHWWDKVRARLSRLILIRLPGDSDDAVLDNLDRLATQTAQDDLDGALSTLDALPALAKDHLQEFRSRLMQRQAAETALLRIVDRLSAGAAS